MTKPEKETTKKQEQEEAVNNNFLTKKKFTEQILVEDVPTKNIITSQPVSTENTIQENISKIQHSTILVQMNAKN